MTPEGAKPRGEGLPWPPPGLERMQGDLWGVVRSGWLAGALLVLPLLLATTTGVSSPGPLADAWWLGVAVASIGLAFAVDLFVRLARMARRARRAIERGYDPRTVLTVVSDRRRDMGFLLQGARHFSVMERADRDLLVSVRLLAAVLTAAAGVWLCLSLALGLFAAARGWVGPDGFRYLVLVPSGAAYLVGLVVSLTDDARVRRARRAWHTEAWEDDLDPERIAAWRERAGVVPRQEGEARTGPRLRRLATALTVAAVVVILPVLLLLPVSAVGPLVAAVSFPRYEGVQRRAAELEVYRVYRVSPDPSITPGEAGRLLQTVAYVGEEGPVPVGEREPPARVEEPWLPRPAGAGPIGVPPTVWHDTVFALARSGPSAEVRTFLADIADHAALADFSRLARALRLDAAGARWLDPLPDAVRAGGLPAPTLHGVRAGAHAMIAAAAHELLQGRVSAAETLVQEVVSVGFLLADQGPTLTDNLVGHALIREGGLALERLFEATGRAERAAEIASARGTGERAADRMHAPLPESAEALARMLPGLVLDSATVRGLAWESFAVMSTLAPCLNLSRVVFGPNETHRAFVEAARDALVRWPSEEALFRVAARGFLQRPEASPFEPLRLLSLAVRSGRGSCGEALGRFTTTDAAGG